MAKLRESLTNLSALLSLCRYSLSTLNNLTIGRRWFYRTKYKFQNFFKGLKKRGSFPFENSICFLSGLYLRKSISWHTLLTTSVI